MQADSFIFTIGHSTHSAERFIQLLKAHNIDIVYDVRSAPYSRFNPTFNQYELKHTLSEHGIQYVFIGDVLGGRSNEDSDYIDGRVSYARLKQKAGFRAGIGKVIEASKTHRIALMCSEKEPLDCHRFILLSNELSSQGIKIKHILADGNVETHLESIERVLIRHHLDEPDLFRTQEEIITEALYLQEIKVAYKLPI